MLCIYCSGSTSVTNSRLQKRDNNTWRRRLCSVCGAIFTTTEQAELGKSFAYRPSPNNIEPFQRDKLLFSIYDSLKHRNTATADSSELTATVIALLPASDSPGVINRADLIALTAKVLSRFDNAAGVYYTAFHKI